ncbi:MAG: SusD/RagB family nutrient-binding outer membrane lipoprotein [Rufibacter sp.]
MKKLYIALFTCFALGSCDDLSDMNINPNAPSDASGTQLIANAALALPELSSSPNGEFMAQYLAETQYVTASLYPEGATSFYGWYTGPLMNLQAVLDNPEKLNGNEGPVANQLAVAKILKAYYMWNITDRWGDVPFTEALKGAEDFTPAYDTQESIYNALFVMLREANDQIVSGNISNDIVYGGNMTRWKKLGNTIRLLMALRLSKVNPTKGKTEFNAALTDGIMTSNADNLVFKHLKDANNQNYWYGQVVAQNREWWALTETLVNEMKPVSDPRLPVYGQPARSGGQYTGLQFGRTTGMNTTNFSLLGTAIYAQDAPVYLVTYAQALFAKAEAAKLGWIAGGDTEAEANYKEAVKQSIIQWTGSDAGVAAFLARPEIAYTPATAIEKIATQRWVHLFMHGYEAWAEWRRTGYPDNLVAPDGKAVPTRLMYTANEALINADNYKAALQRIGGTDGLYGKVWWDVD